MKLTEKFTLTGMDPQPGALAGFWVSMTLTEVATALAAGSGAGVPDSNGNVTPGTIVAGHIVAMGSTGTLDLMTSLTLASNMPQLPFVVFSGDNDFSGASVGDAIAIHGGCRFDTQKYDTAGTYTSGTPLIATAGLLTPKLSASDHIQAVAYVGPRGLVNGVLDVIKPQGIFGY